MKNSLKILSFLIFSISINSCKNKGIDDNKKIEHETIKQSNWTDSLKSSFISSNSQTDFDKFVLREVISQIEFEKTDKELEEYLKTVDYEVYKKSMTKYFIVNVDNLARKSKDAIERLLGKPNETEKVSPSNTPCPCDKYFYLEGLIEIVFINGQADWITINNVPSKIIVDYPDTYQSIDEFDDYTYVKVNTN